MEITARQEAEVQVLECSGRLTMVTARSLRDAVEQALGAGPPRLVLDLGEVGFVDSSGLGALISALKRARQAGGDLRIAAVTEQVRTVLKLTNLDRVLRPYADVPGARDGW
ncbi:STAS domain-containing protein [Georgenia satyanarayanai]|uniref:STAS domain-containing protein n=1 Tax=Georgenia satyanarayanai TaxID=860221 RepID=UPI0012659F21|nr:STAS domain-containing protein [Georgenia satyanarayanai]